MELFLRILLAIVTGTFLGVWLYAVIQVFRALAKYLAT